MDNDPVTESTGPVAAVIIALGLFAIFLLPAVLARVGITPRPPLAAPAELTPVRTPPPDPLATISLLAKAAIAVDAQTGEVIYAKNKDWSLPLASLAKLMTGLVAAETAPPNTVVNVDRRAVAETGDDGLLVGEKWSLGDLIDFTLVTSSNDGAKAIASAAMAWLPSENDFVSLMNAEAKTIGLTATHFFNETGLDINARENGAYGSAADIARLLIYISRREPALLAATNQSRVTKESLGQHRHNATNTNELVKTQPGILASKTGFTDLAGGNLAVIFDRGLNQLAVVVVLGSTFDGRFNDIERLMNATTIKLSQTLSDR